MGASRRPRQQQMIAFSPSYAQGLLQEEHALPRRQLVLLGVNDSDEGEGQVVLSAVPHHQQQRSISVMPYLYV